MKKTVLFLIVIFTVITLASPFATARSRHPFVGAKHDSKDRIIEVLIEKLNLTDEQLDKITALKKDQVIKKFDERVAIMKLMREKRKLMEAEQMDKESIFAVIDKLADLRAKNMKEMHLHHQKIMEILTPEQQANLKQMLDKHPGSKKLHGKMHGVKDRIQDKIREHMGRHSEKRILSKLDLTEEQENKVTEIIKKRMADGVDDWKEIDKIKEKMEEYKVSGKTDTAEINKLIDLLFEKKAEMEKRGVEDRISIHSILTAEQVKKMQDLKSKIKHHWKDKRGDMDLPDEPVDEDLPEED